MMKKIFNKLSLAACSMAITLLMTGCTKEQSIEIPLKREPNVTIIDFGGAGNFKITNSTTGEYFEISKAINVTIDVNGGIVSVSQPTLTVHNGDKVKVEFAKAEKYADYSFNTKFTLHDGTVIENENPYEYMVSDTAPGEYKISFSALSTEQPISADGSLKIILSE